MMSPPARAKVHDIGFVPELCSDRKAERKIHREKETERERERESLSSLSLERGTSDKREIVVVVSGSADAYVVIS